MQTYKERITMSNFFVDRKEEQIKDLQLEIDQENRMAENLVQGMVSHVTLFLTLLPFCVHVIFLECANL